MGSHPKPEDKKTTDGVLVCEDGSQTDFIIMDCCMCAKGGESPHCRFTPRHFVIQPNYVLLHLSKRMQIWHLHVSHPDEKTAHAYVSRPATNYIHDLFFFSFFFERS